MPEMRRGRAQRHVGAAPERATYCRPCPVRLQLRSRGLPAGGAAQRHGENGIV